MQLNGIFWEKFFFFKFVFSECNFTCVFICFFICQSTIFILLIFSAEYFSSFSLNCARTLERAVDKLWNGSRVIFILESKARVCFEAARLSNKTEGVISHIF